MLQLSIITPVFNRADCIERCIESIATQNTASIEHVIVNDGSTDETGEICERLAKVYPHIKYIDLQKNFGVNYAFNRGIEASSGDFVSFLGSDDIFLADSIDLILKTIEDNNQYKHFLFVPDDLEESFNKNHYLSKDSHIFTYEDWLRGTAAGDFVHIILRETFKGNLFSEEFRIYESLNFLRIYRANHKQLYINRTVVSRERNRPDSVSKEYQLDNRRSMENHYRYTQKLLEWFHKDYTTFNIRTIDEEIIKTIIIGLSLGKYSENNKLFAYLQEKNIKARILAFMNSIHLGSFFYFLIIIKSVTNTIRRRI